MRTTLLSMLLVVSLGLSWANDIPIFLPDACENRGDPLESRCEEFVFSHFGVDVDDHLDLSNECLAANPGAPTCTPADKFDTASDSGPDVHHDCMDFICSTYVPEVAVFGDNPVSLPITLTTEAEDITDNPPGLRYGSSAWLKCQWYRTDIEPPLSTLAPIEMWSFRLWATISDDSPDLDVRCWDKDGVEMTKGASPGQGDFFLLQDPPDWVQLENVTAIFTKVVIVATNVAADDHLFMYKCAFKVNPRAECSVVYDNMKPCIPDGIDRGLTCPPNSDIPECLIPWDALPASDDLPPDYMATNDCDLSNDTIRDTVQIVPNIPPAPPGVVMDVPCSQLWDDMIGHSPIDAVHYENGATLPSPGALATYPLRPVFVGELFGAGVSPNIAHPDHIAVKYPLAADLGGMVWVDFTTNGPNYRCGATETFPYTSDVGTVDSVSYIGGSSASVFTITLYKHDAANNVPDLSAKYPVAFMCVTFSVHAANPPSEGFDLWVEFLTTAGSHSIQSVHFDPDELCKNPSTGDFYTANERLQECAPGGTLNSGGQPDRCCSGIFTSRFCVPSNGTCPDTPILDENLITGVELHSTSTSCTLMFRKLELGVKCREENGEGDPHFTGFGGGEFDVMGEPNKIFAIFSDKDLHVNARFIQYPGYDDETYMGEIAVLAGSHRVFLDTSGMAVITPFQPGGEAGEYVLEDGGMVTYKDNVLEVRYHGWYIRVVRRVTLQSLEDGQEHRHLDMMVDTLNGEYPMTTPHGILGQTARKGRGRAVSSGKQGEGVLEGHWTDYVIESDDIYDTSFKYSQWEGYL